MSTIIIGLGSLGALIIALLTFVSTQLATRRSVDSTYVASLEGRLRDAESRVTSCEVARERLQAEINTVREDNLWLTRKLVSLARDGKISFDDSDVQVRRAMEPVKAMDAP